MTMPTVSMAIGSRSAVSSVAFTLATAAIFAPAARAQEAQDTKLTFELADAAGKTIKSSDFASRYLLIVHQGVP